MTPVTFDSIYIQLIAPFISALVTYIFTVRSKRLANESTYIDNLNKAQKSLSELYEEQKEKSRQCMEQKKKKIGDLKSQFVECKQQLEAAINERKQ